MIEYSLELAACEATILREVADKAATRNTVAKTYALAMRSSEHGRRLIDWERVNKAIVKRWSLHALEWIKERAWSGKCFAPARGAAENERSE